jgi:hypothetical protein
MVNTIREALAVRTKITKDIAAAGNSTARSAARRAVSSGASRGRADRREILARSQVVIGIDAQPRAAHAAGNQHQASGRLTVVTRN